MAAPTILRSSDTGAPVLNGSAGALVQLLDAGLVRGYGATRATGTITSSGVNVSNNDTVTVDGTVYTFKTALTPAANEVLIGANAAASLTNLCAAMSAWGTSGTTYGAGTTQQTNVQVTALTATVITLQAYVGGTGGNSIALAKAAATLTLSGATLAGGAGTDTTASLGWGSPFTAANKRVYRAASGARHYLDVDDSAPNTTANGRNAFLRGYEVMTAVATGTGLFPTTTQVTSCVIPKSNTADVTARPWILIGDGLTFVLWLKASGTNPPNLATNTWGTVLIFGEMLSALTGDNYRSIIYFPSTTATLTTDTGPPTNPGTNAGTGTVNCAMPRTYTGVGSAIWATPVMNPYWPGAGGQAFPNQVDGGLYTNAHDVAERGNGTTAAASSGFGIRGRLRGLYQSLYTNSAFNDQDTFTGVGDFTGKTFMIVKDTSSALIVETTAWDASS